MTAKQPKEHLRVGRGMYAVTIRQPQAAAVLARPGPFEHRGWETDYRGPLLIHAARWAAGDPPVGRSDGPAYGALLGVVELVDCIVNGRAGGDPDEVGYVWVLANPRTFTSPVPYGGRMGLFLVADAVVAGVLAGLAPPRGRFRPPSKPFTTKAAEQLPPPIRRLTAPHSQQGTAMAQAADMESRMRAVLHHACEAVLHADRGCRFLERVDRRRPRWPSLRGFMLAALHESGGDDNAAGRFERLPGTEQDRLLRYYERAYQPCKGLAIYTPKRPRGCRGE